MKHLLRSILALCALAACAAAAPLTTNPITEDGTYTVTTFPGKRYVFSAAGTFGGGSLAVKWNDGTTATAFPNSPASSAETWTFTAPSKQVDLVLSGATDPSITVRISQADGNVVDNSAVAEAIAEDPAEIVSAISIPHVNVRHFGAVGDGVADDTAEIQAAIAAAKSAKRAIYLPAGTYKITDTLTLDWEGATIFGDSGMVYGASTKIVTTSTTASVIKVPADYNGVRILNLLIEGPGRATSTGYGIEFRGELGGGSNIDHSEISGCRITGFGTGIYYRGVANSIISKTSAINCNVCVDSLGNNNSNTFQNCAFAADSGAADVIGLRMANGMGCSVINCDMGGPSMIQCVETSATDTSFFGGNWESYGSGIKITSDTASTALIGVAIRGFGDASSTRWSVETPDANVSIINCILGVVNTANSASIRQNSAISRNLKVAGSGAAKVDLYSGGTTYNATVNIGDAFPTESQASGEAAGASNHGVIWRRVNSGSNDVLNCGVRNAAGTFAWANLLDYHFDKAANGNPAWLGASNTFTGPMQAIGAASLTAPYWMIWTGSNTQQNRMILGLATGSSQFVTTTTAKDAVWLTQSGGNLILATNTTGNNQVERLRIKADGRLNTTSAAIPNYADDAAADAALASGDLYTTTAGGRTVFRKP